MAGGNGNGSGPLDETLITALLNDIHADISENVVAYRQGQRWEQSFAPATLPAAPAKQTAVKEGGVYLITGGLGGIALVMAGKPGPPSPRQAGTDLPFRPAGANRMGQLAHPRRRSQ
ncbi:MAG: hypothetical protein M5U34_23495 [Chloroflexi bacterium]|nr:hypothetical protein [Chloroflexota bacterium]